MSIFSGDSINKVFVIVFVHFNSKYMFTLTWYSEYILKVFAIYIFIDIYF